MVSTHGRRSTHLSVLRATSPQPSITRTAQHRCGSVRLAIANGSEHVVPFVFVLREQPVCGMFDAHSDVHGCHAVGGGLDVPRYAGGV